MQSVRYNFYGDDMQENDKIEEKKNSKKRYLLLILLLLLFFLIGIILYFCFFHEKPSKKEKDNKSEITFKDVAKLNYGAFDIQDFINGEILCKDTCTYNGKEIKSHISEVEGLGKQKVTVDVTYEEKKYSKTYEIEIVDEIAPKIILSENEITLHLNDSFDPKNYVLDVTDNYDGNLLDNLMIDNPVDTMKVETYTVTYSVTDSNGNETKETLTVIVTDQSSEENPSNPNSNINTNSNSSSNKSNSSSNKTSSSNKNSSSNKPSSSNSNKPSSSNSNTNSNTKVSAFERDVNASKLTPLKTGVKELDTQVEEILNKIINNSMTNYEKLKAIYLWVIDYVERYERSPLAINYTGYMYTYHFSKADALAVSRAVDTLEYKTGACGEYSSLFMVFARRAGFETYLVNGQVKKSGGGYTGHTWINIKANGNWYAIDTQIADSWNAPDTYFGLDKNDSIYKYDDWNGDIAGFQGWRALDPMNLKVSIPEWNFDLKDEVFGAYIDIRTSGSETIQTKINDTIHLSWEASSEEKSSYSISLAIQGNDNNFEEIPINGSSTSYTFTKAGSYNLYIVIDDKLGREIEIIQAVEVTE